MQELRRSKRIAENSKKPYDKKIAAKNGRNKKASTEFIQKVINRQKQHILISRKNYQKPF